MCFVLTVNVLKHPRAPSNSLGLMDYQNADHEQLMKRLRSAQTSNEVTYPAHPPHPSASLDDLPRNVVSTMRQGSVVMSMDFHPAHHTLLAGQSISTIKSLLEFEHFLLALVF